MKGQVALRHILSPQHCECDHFELHLYEKKAVQVVKTSSNEIFSLIACHRVPVLVVSGFISCKSQLLLERQAHDGAPRLRYLGNHDIWLGQVHQPMAF